MSEPGSIVVTRNGAVGTIVFSNAKRRNALTLTMWQAFGEALHELAADSAIRVVILTGEGDKAFGSGADITRFDADRSTPEAIARYDAITGATSRALQEFPKPTVALIRGYCVGGGLSIALGCDLRIAGESALFAVPAAKLGIGYNYAGVKRMIDVIGPAATKEFFFTGRTYSASEAYGIGLVNRVSPDAAVEREVHDYAGTIAANAPLTVLSIKTIVAEALKDPAQRNDALCVEVVRRCFESADYAEGRRAFAEKRRPGFTGT
jgi:enoyl-CoA hydratase/carnithine racemase